jgi:HEAT repeat protein
VTEALAAVRWLLSQAEPEARRTAAQQLVKLDGGTAVEFLVKALGDEDWRVRREAAQAAPLIAPREVIVAALVPLLSNEENIGLRNSAVEALAAIGADAIGPILDVLLDLSSDGKKLAIEALAGITDERSASALEALLENDDVNVACASAEALAQVAKRSEDLRADAVAALVRNVERADTYFRVALLEGLKLLEAELPWSVYAQVASDPMLRRYAVSAAARVDDREAIDLLVNTVAKGTRVLAREAVIVLGEKVHHAAESPELVVYVQKAFERLSVLSAPLLAFARAHDDLAVRAGAITLLGLVRDPATIPAIIGALSEESLAERAERALKLVGGDALGPIMALARSREPSARVSALSMMPSFAHTAKDEVRQTLHGALRDESNEVKATALRVLGTTGDADDMERIMPMLTDADPRVAAAAVAALEPLARRYADRAVELVSGVEVEGPLASAACVVFAALAEEGPFPPARLRFLERALASTDPRVRRHAVDALAVNPTDDVVDVLQLGLADEERDVQLAAMRALGRAGRSEPIEILILGARDGELVASGLSALAEYDEPSAVSLAGRLVDARDPLVACAAVDALGRAGGEQARRSLLGALAHPDADVVRLALTELGAPAMEVERDAMARCLRHPSPSVRRSAVDAIGQERSRESRRIVRRRLDDETDPRVIEMILAVLAEGASDAGVA